MLQNAYGQDLFWLNTANVVLGIVVAVCFGVLAFGLFREFQLRARKRAAMHAEIDSDLRGMMGDHAFDVAGLGLTMADGGEPVRKEQNKKKAR